MRKYLLIPMGLIMFACGGEEVSDDSNNDVETADSSIVEYDIDSSRTIAVGFNNEMTLMQNDMLNIISVLFQSDSSNAAINHENALFEAKVNYAELENMKFDGSEVEFVNAMKDLMQFYIDELDGPFREIVPLLEKPTLTAKEEKKLRSYDAQFAIDEKAYFMKVFEAQDEFAEANNIELIEQ